MADRVHRRFGGGSAEGSAGFAGVGAAGEARVGRTASTAAATRGSASNDGARTRALTTPCDAPRPPRPAPPRPPDPGPGRAPDPRPGRGVAGDAAIIVRERMKYRRDVR